MHTITAVVLNTNYVIYFRSLIIIYCRLKVDSLNVARGRPP